MPFVAALSSWSPVRSYSLGSPLVTVHQRSPVATHFVAIVALFLISIAHFRPGPPHLLRHRVVFADHRRSLLFVTALSSSLRSHPHMSQIVADHPFASHFSTTIVFENFNTSLHTHPHPAPAPHLLRHRVVFADHRRSLLFVTALSSSLRSHPRMSQIIADHPFASHFSMTIVFENFNTSLQTHPHPAPAPHLLLLLPIFADCQQLLWLFLRHTLAVHPSANCSLREPTNPLKG